MWGMGKNRLKSEENKEARSDEQEGIPAHATRIAAKAMISGDVQFDGLLIVEGVVQGNIWAEEGSGAELRLLESGQVEGQIQVPNVRLNGRVYGDVHADSYLELGAQAMVTGNVHYSLIEMAMGAEINGALMHNVASKPETSASDTPSLTGSAYATTETLSTEVDPA